MATTLPAGDPGLSQNAGDAQLAWQNRPQKTVQFQGLDDATATAGQAPNPNAPPPPAPAPAGPPQLTDEQIKQQAIAKDQAQEAAYNASNWDPTKSQGTAPPAQAQTRLRDVGNGFGEPGYQRQGGGPFGGSQGGNGGAPGSGGSPLGGFGSGFGGAFSHWLSAASRMTGGNGNTPKYGGDPYTLGTPSSAPPYQPDTPTTASTNPGAASTAFAYNPSPSTPTGHAAGWAGDDQAPPPQNGLT